MSEHPDDATIARLRTTQVSQRGRDGMMRALADADRPRYAPGGRLSGFIRPESVAMLAAYGGDTRPEPRYPHRDPTAAAYQEDYRD